MAENIHSGHRKRMYEKLESGAEMPEHELMEMILYGVIRQQNTNEAAHRLIDEFGSIEQVLNTHPKQLATVKGVGESIANYLYLLGKVFERINNGEPPERIEEGTSYDFFIKLLGGKKREQFYIVCLDSKDNVLVQRKLFEGSFEFTDMDPAKAVKTALDFNSSQVIFAHNHPNGIAKASQADINATKVLIRAMSMMGIRVRDHVIVAGDVCISMRAKNSSVWYDKKQF